MKSKLTKIILLVTLAILPLAFAQAQTTKKTKKKTVKTKRMTRNVEPILPAEITPVSQDNELPPVVPKQTRIIQIPVDINAAELDMNADNTAVLIQINSYKQIYLKDKLITDATIRDITNSSELSLTASKSYKPIYVKADVSLTFEEVMKIVKDLVVRLQNNSPTPPPTPDARQAVKFIVHKEKDTKLEKGNYVLNLNLPFHTTLPSLDLTVEIIKPDDFIFNNQTKTASELTKELTSIFKEREANGIFYKGTNEVYRAVRLKVSPNTKYGDVIKAVNQIYYSGADWIIDETNTKISSKLVKNNPTTKDEPIIPDKITVAPNTTKARQLGSTKTETINKIGIGSLSVPSNMIAEPIKEETKKNGEVEWTTYRYEWKTPVLEKSSEPSLKAEISTNVYNVDFDKVAPDLPAERRNAESLLQIEHLANLNSKKQFDDNRIKDVKMLNLDGLDATCVLFNFPSTPNLFVFTCQSYRLLDDKAQSINISVEGDSKEVTSKAEQIIKSFKLSAK